MEEVKIQGVRIQSFLEFHDLNVKDCEQNLILSEGWMAVAILRPYESP